MSDQLFPEETASFRGKWLVGLWMLSTVLGTTVWWAGLAWVAVRVTQAAF